MKEHHEKKEDFLKKNKEREKRAFDLISANEKIALQINKKDRRVKELLMELLATDKELAFQKEEKANREQELVIANIELGFQNNEKAHRETELIEIEDKVILQSKEIIYLRNFDQLTGLYNRNFYEEELKRLDKVINLPLTIAIGNINGLKMLNDSFGHDVGDENLKRIAMNIKKACRDKDVVARLGGDEFVIIMPETNKVEADKIIKKIYNIGLKEKKDILCASISFGYETKFAKEESTFEIFKKAEDNMYENKTYESSSSKNKIVELIMNTLYEKSNRELFHSKRVGELCESIAIKLGFEKDDINKMKTAGFLHDIGKIGVNEKILNKHGKLNIDEWNEIKKHPEIGYRILSSSNEFSIISQCVLEHQEHFDGSGYPRNLKGKEISIQARIIAVADSFDAMKAHRTYGKTLSKSQAVNELNSCSGTQFDPDIVKVFIENELYV